MKKFRRCGLFYVYIVECKDGTYYTGYTPDVEKRIELHNKGKGAKCLRGKLPVELVYVKKFRSLKSALREERNIKKLTHSQKEKLVNRERR